MMNNIPSNYPHVYVSYFDDEHINLIGKDSTKYNGELSSRKLGGIWGDYERVCNSLKFSDLEERNILLQELINQKVPFAYDDRQMSDPVDSIASIRKNGDVFGVIETVKIIVSYSINVEYAEI